MNADLQAFNQVLTVPPTWTPVPGGPTIYAANLLVANGNAGPSISGRNFLAAIMPQLYEEKAMGAQAILVQIGFPLLYAPFQGGATQLQPYLTFYQGVAQAVHALGMKLIVENDILLANDVQSGWPNLTAYFSTLSWDTYVQARATMAATLAETMQPDYLVLAEEPDTEAAQAGQPNLNNATFAAQMVSAEITAVRTSTFPNIKLGAGFGAWPQFGGSTTLTQFATAYGALPLDYIDTHVYPINTVSSGSLISLSLTIASLAAASGKPIAMSEAWLWKMEDLEWHNLSADQYRARNPFSFWAPLDIYFQQTMQNLATYTNMLYVAEDGPDYLFTYQTFGGTAANGGLANCTCTTSYCDNYDILVSENHLTNAANNVAEYSTTGFSFYNAMVTTPDTTAPSTPTGLTGTAAFALTNLTWTASTDDVGVAGYNVYRCSPATLGGSCTGVQVGTTSVPSYTDQNLTSNTPYNYQVQAFDLANNTSQPSQTLSLITYRTSADAPTSLTATAVSPKEIDLSWTPPSNITGLTQYFLYSGTSANNLQQFATTPSSKTTFNNAPLAAGTAYYYAVVAREGGLNSPMSPLAIATTLPLPNPPSNVTATPVSSTSITLTWQETQASGGLPVARYQIWEGTVPGSLTNITLVNKTSYTGRNLNPGTTYYFEIVAVDTSSDVSIPSVQVSAATWPLPLAPTNLQAATPAATQIALSWQWSQGGGLPLGHYYVYCGASPASLVKVGTATNSSFT
ncbi:MAG TPA: fibronectin type III domain-containing protein, partial [Bryobacteraceae bacterium]|nr:fibronectin type III domain-containing protein [Bryobacteraceae bacterium]